MKSCTIPSPTRHLKPREWASFFDAVTSARAGDRAVIERVDRDGSMTTDAIDRTLVSITFRHGREALDTLEVHLAGGAEPAVTHVVSRPSAVGVHETEGHPSATAIRVDSHDGETTFIYLTAARPHAAAH